jgi:hypothetical protein
MITLHSKLTELTRTYKQSCKWLFDYIFFKFKPFSYRGSLGSCKSIEINVGVSQLTNLHHLHNIYTNAVSIFLKSFNLIQERPCLLGLDPPNYTTD